MKKLIVLLLSLLIALNLCACAIPTVTAPSPDPTETTVVTEPDGTTEDLVAGAEAILVECSKTQSWDESFIPTVLTQVPDIFMLSEIRCACWTYFLVMSDGIEFVIYTDYDGVITSISYWEDGSNGPTIYPIE
jgi:hypothetical protein